MKGLQDSEKKVDPATLDALMDEVEPLLGADSTSITRWLESTYGADFDKLDPEKEKVIKSALGKVLSDATILARAITDLQKANDWYGDIGADNVDEMVHTLAAESKEVLALFLEHMSAKRLMGVEKMKFQSWKDVLKKSKAESGEPAEGEFL